MIKRLVLPAVMSITVLFLVVIFKMGQTKNVWAAPGSWVQTNWIGGSGQASWSDSTKYSSANNINDTAAGQITLLSTGNWYNNSWTGRKQITIDHTKVSSTQTDYPMLVNLATDTDLAAGAQADADDILFTSTDGVTKLDHEVEKYTTATGSLQAWVRIPSLSSTTDTTIYMYYGNSGASSQQNKAGVWVNYAAVYHLNEPSGQHADAAGTNTTNSVVVAQQGANVGRADGADEFNGTNSIVTAPDSATLTPASNMTIESWVNFTALPSTRAEIGVLAKKQHTLTPFSSYSLEMQTNNAFCFKWISDLSVTSTRCNNTVLGSTGTWFYVAATRNGAVLNAYRNGASDDGFTSGTPTGNIFDSNSTLNIGANAPSNSRTAGFLDEIRISTIARPAAYFSTTFANMNAPSSFYALGTAQSNSGTSGTLTSSIFDITGPADFGTLSFTATVPTNSTVTIKVRTGNSPTLADATAFASCTTIASGIDISGNTCVHDRDRYIQYQTTLANTDSAASPVLSDVTINYDDAAPTISTFVNRVGDKLYLNGSRFKFHGANIYWLGLDENTGGILFPTKFRIDDVLASAKELGVSVVRSHAALSVGCANCIQPTRGVFNDAAFDSLDYAIKIAGNYNIKLVLPLVDQYTYYHGGVPTYSAWRGVTNAQFFSDTNVINDYKAHISHVLNHVNPYTGLAYKDDPTIMAWETGNELNKQGTTWDPAWTADIAAYIKSIDSNHLVADGYVANVTITEINEPSLLFSTVDMYSAHDYPMTNSKTNTSAALANSYNKVFFIGEYDWSSAGGGDTLTSFLSNIESNPSISGDIYWNLFGHNDTYGYVHHNDGIYNYTLYYPGTTDDMRTKAQQLRTHGYFQQGIAVPQDATTGSPTIHHVTRVPTGLQVEWRGVANTRYYSVERSTDNATWSVIDGNVTDDEVPWIDTSVTVGRKYYYRVRSFNLDDVAGSYSASDSNDGQLLQNISLEYDPSIMPYWVTSTSSAAVAEFTVDNSTSSVGTQSAKINVIAVDGTSFHIQMRQLNMHLINGAQYTVSFDAKASAGRNIEGVLQYQNSPFTNFITSTKAITTSWQPYSFTYTPSGDLDNVMLVFNLGQVTGQVWLDNIQVQGPLPDGDPPTAPGTPTTTSPTNSTTQNWVWTAATDAISGVASYTWRVQDSLGATVSSGSTTLTSLITNLTQGVWTLFVNAVDNVGISGPESNGSVTVLGIPSPVPTPQGSSTSSPSHGDSFSASLPPTCGDFKPAGIADVFQINRTGSTVKIYFTPVSGNTQKYHVIFGFKEGDERFGLLSADVNQETNNGVQSVIIHDLDPRTTYWFKVAPVNGCAVGDWSNWLKADGSRAKNSVFYRYFTAPLKKVLGR